jgi:hypothetical protein
MTSDRYRTRVRATEPPQDLFVQVTCVLDPHAMHMVACAPPVTIQARQRPKSVTSLRSARLGTTQASMWRQSP